MPYSDLDAIPGADENVLHVHPRYGRGHELDSYTGDCWCRPRVEPVTEHGVVTGYLILHREQN